MNLLVDIPVHGSAKKEEKKNASAQNSPPTTTTPHPTPNSGVSQRPNKTITVAVHDLLSALHELTR